MKKIILSLVAAFLSVGVFAQQVSSLNIIPSPTTSTADLKVVVATVFPGSPCSFVSAFNPTQSHDTLIFDAIYCFESDGPVPCTHVDTFDIGQLNAGTYVVRFRLTSTAQGAACGSASYVLRDIAFQAFTVTTGTTGIGTVKPLNVVISPNPVTDNVYFSFENKSTAEIKLFDISGKVVKTAVFKAGEEMKFNVAELPANVYFYTIKTPEQNVSGKILVD